MANITVTTPGPANADVEVETTRSCGEDIAAGDVMTVNTSGAWIKSVAGDGKKPRAISPRAEKSGRKLTGHRRGEYGGFTGLTPGNDLFTSATAGRLADASATGARVVGYALTSSSIYFDFPAASAQA